MTTDDSDHYDDDTYTIMIIVILDTLLFAIFVLLCRCVRVTKHSRIDVACQTDTELRHVVVLSPSDETGLGVVQ